MIFRLAEMARPSCSLELGSNLGLTTAYLASAVSPSKVISIEGDPELANLAAENLQRLDLKNVEIVTANFDDVLPEVLHNHTIDFFFIDGNHTKDATLRYWNMIAPHLTPRSVVVFDDIHWSEGMEEAWNEIISDSRVRLSLDFYCMGVLFFRDGLTRQHFVLKMPL
jgi:predicted O-methyltransferase YrrM